MKFSSHEKDRMSFSCLYGKKTPSFKAKKGKKLFPVILAT